MFLTYVGGDFICATMMFCLNCEVIFVLAAADGVVNISFCVNCACFVLMNILFL